MVETMTIRQQQVARRLLAEISDIVRNAMRDPRLGFVTLVAAEPSRDLKVARIYISVMGDADQRRECLDALSGAAGYIRVMLGRRLTMRYVPELRFQSDDSAESAQRLEEILRSIAGSAGGSEPTEPLEDDCLHDRASPRDT